MEGRTDNALRHTQQGNGREGKGADTAPGTRRKSGQERGSRLLWGLGPSSRQQTSELAGSGQGGSPRRHRNLQPTTQQPGRQQGEQPSPSGRTRPQVAGQLGPWKVLQSPFGTFHIQVLPSAVPARRTGARGCHSIHWAERRGQQAGLSPHSPRSPSISSTQAVLASEGGRDWARTEPDTRAAPGQHTAFKPAWSGKGETGPPHPQLLAPTRAPHSSTPL